MTSVFSLLLIGIIVVCLAYIFIFFGLYNALALFMFNVPPLTHRYAVLFYGVIAVLFTTRWWWWSDEWKQKFYKPLVQSLITLASLSTKLLFTCLIILWYVRMKMYQEPELQKVVDPAVPTIIWPGKVLRF